MTTFALLSRLSQKLSAFRRDRRAASIVEFAMVLPLMVTMYIGVVEVTNGVAAQRKVTLAARTVADLVTQFKAIKNADMDGILSAAPAIMFPSDPKPLKVTVSAVSIDAKGVAKIVWTDSYNGGTEPKRKKDDVVTLPTDVLKIPETQLIWGEVTYTYTPGLGNFFISTVTLSDNIFMAPRLSETVTRNPS
jgi:Flp pilus assembly protein TadG